MTGTPPPDPHSHLDAAAAAAEQGDWGRCLSSLLVAWRQAPDPALAALIERVSPRAAGPAIGGGGSDTANVMRRIASAGDGDVAPILELALRQLRVFPRAYLWILELARRGRDPRIASALVEVLREPPFVELRRDRQGALLPEVTAALDAIDDPRYRGFLTEEATRLEARRRYIRKHRRGLDALAEIAREIATRPPPPALELATHAARIDAALGHQHPTIRTRGRQADELLEAIRDDPADLALRAIYADVLQEAGDVRGEHVALQCARGADEPPSRRERELEKLHGRTWLGDIEPIVNKQGVVYRRGFVACAREGLKYTRDYPLLASRAWATLEELDVGVWGEHAIALLAGRKVLRRVWGLGDETLRLLAKQPEPLGWMTLGVRYVTAETAGLVDALLPELVELDLSRGGRVLPTLQVLAARPLGARLRRIRVPRTPEAPRELQRATSAELELVADYTFPGDPSGEAVRLAGDRVTLVFHNHKLDAKYACRVLERLDPPVTEVTIEAPAKARVDPASWAKLEALLASRFGVTLAPR